MSTWRGYTARACGKLWRGSEDVPYTFDKREEDEKEKKIHKKKRNAESSCSDGV